MKTVKAIVCAATLACAVLTFGACAKGAGVVEVFVAVTFDSQGGGSVLAEKTLPGYPVNEPANLTNAEDGDLVFSGWYMEASCATRWDFDDPVTEDMTMYAKWNAADSLTFSAISGGAAWEVSKGTGTMDADLYIPSYYKGLPVTKTATYGFQNCSGISDLCLSEGFAELGYGSFWGCTSLCAVDIPESVTSIAEYAFYNCTSLGGTIEIPRNVASIGYNAFWYCYPMTAIHVDPNNAYFSSLDGVLFDKAMEKLIISPCGRTLADYVIPSTVRTIGLFGFTNNTALTRVTIPASVTTIEYCAFSNCDGLTSVFIPSSVTTVSLSVFGGCYSAQIHCQAAEKPAGWLNGWDSNSGTVTWGCSE